MTRHFNTGGPCFPDQHDMLPPERSLGQVMELIEDGLYVTLHGGRWTGKTTSAQWLTDHYNTGEQLCAIWVDLQCATDQPDPDLAFRALLGALDDAVERVLPAAGMALDRERFLRLPGNAVLKYLLALVARCPRPLVVFFDGTDGLASSTMSSLLAQIRSGYNARWDSRFPHSVALIGRRDVTHAHPFFNTNIPATLRPFAEGDVAELLVQHTTATGQRFEPEAVARIHELSQGHPWLVNVLAEQLVVRDVRDRSIPITPGHVAAAMTVVAHERRAAVDELMLELHESSARTALLRHLSRNGLDLVHALGLHTPSSRLTS